jgi:hypothetical protein
MKTDELLFLPDKALLNHDQENSSHLTSVLSRQNGASQ